jgi:aminoglycoside phosphotransferase (APT) family kinase protein
VPAVDVPLPELQRRLTPLGVRDLRPLAGGASSLTYTAGARGRRVVVKVAPAGVPPVRNRDVLRQARMLRALARTTIPVPEVMWEDAGDPPDVPPLFVMTFVSGSSFEPLFDRDGTDGTKTVAARMHNACELLAALHAVDPAAIGLGAEPVVTPGEEIERWCRLLATVDTALAPGWEDVAAALRSSEPPARAPAIVHGDFRLGNLLASSERITAVVDWEIWTIGDPRVDLGWFLVNADPDTYRRATRYAGSLPAPAALASVYGDAPDRTWFEALACFKSTATWSLIVKHNRRRGAPDADVEATAAVLPHLLDCARSRLA